MNILCWLGFHDWEIEYFGAGYPLRECRRCHRCEVKPIGSYYWHEAGKGTTLKFTRRMHAYYDGQKELEAQLRNGEITMFQYSEETDRLLNRMSELVK